MRPVKIFFFLVRNVHNLQIEMLRRLGCEKPYGRKSVVRALLLFYYIVRVTLDDPSLNCKKFLKYIIGSLCNWRLGWVEHSRYFRAPLSAIF